VRPAPRTIPSRAQDDFDIDRLAAYLHMIPAAVQNWPGAARSPVVASAATWALFQRRNNSPLLEIESSCRMTSARTHGRARSTDASEVSTSRHVSIANLLKPELSRSTRRSHTRHVVVRMSRARRPHAFALGTQDQMPTLVAERARNAFHRASTQLVRCSTRGDAIPFLADALLALGRFPCGIPFGAAALSPIFFPQLFPQAPNGGKKKKHLRNPRAG